MIVNVVTAAAAAAAPKYGDVISRPSRLTNVQCVWIYYYLPDEQLAASVTATGGQAGRLSTTW